MSMQSSSSDQDGKKIPSAFSSTQNAFNSAAAAQQQHFEPKVRHIISPWFLV